MKLRVTTYCQKEQYHMCYTEQGEKHLVDFLIDSLASKGVKPEFLIGKIVQVSHLTPYITIAYGVEVLGDDPDHVKSTTEE